LTLLVRHQEEHPAFKKLSDEVVICLERGADDLHMVQLMPVPLHHLLLHYNHEWLNFSGASLSRWCWKRGC